MGAAVNGLALHGGIVRPYGATFLQFADYMRGAIRLSALMGLHVAWVYSHDSVALGEDGPTHQPVEHLAALRAIPGLTVHPPERRGTRRPRRGASWSRSSTARRARAHPPGPAGARPRRLRRRRAARQRRLRAARRTRGAVATLVGTGSEVSLALEARELLAGEGVAARVVAMPSWELFAAQDDAYREAVLPPGQPKVSVEAGIAMGWAQWVDASVSIERFGASAPGEIVMRELGMTPEHVAEVVRADDRLTD